MQEGGRNTGRTLRRIFAERKRIIGEIDRLYSRGRGSGSRRLLRPRRVGRNIMLGTPSGDTSVTERLRRNPARFVVRRIHKLITT